MGSSKFVVGNWKMHGLRSDGVALAVGIASRAETGLPEGCEVILCPPVTLLSMVADAIFSSGVRLGAQDCHAEAHGAYTGDISAAMLHDLACTHVIVGHSERRRYHGETDALVCKKAEAAAAAHLCPIICVGETQAERDAGKTLEYIQNQVVKCLPEQLGQEQYLIAYEPVWAIGSGKTPSPGDITAVHRAIKKTVAERNACETAAVRVVYGGSVKPENASEILKLQGVDGVLVGGASLELDPFWNIITAAA